MQLIGHDVKIQSFDSDATGCANRLCRVKFTLVILINRVNTLLVLGLIDKSVSMQHFIL